MCTLRVVLVVFLLVQASGFVFDSALSWLVEPHEGRGFFDAVARERAASAILKFLKGCTAPAPAAPAGSGQTP